MKKFRNPSYGFFAFMAIVGGVVLLLADLDKFQDFPRGDTPLRLLGYAGLTVFGVLATRITVEVGPQGVRVVNLTGTRRVRWADITGIALETSLVLTLADGSRVKCVAVQPTNFENASGREGYAHRVVQELDVMRARA
ncbi:PH domain-containing protein [Kitasatospora sp. NPDC051853]|uniref:PH domain-containing protein n=1 Tax=Kitasatospora sp. NPDC051853 TaxID=3364058 RepID=UPI0037B88BF8